ncbi:MAG: hypothetical protein J6J18_09540 [Oscillospiraceae bacterium]|nr:hypothetical protein [Oscillospiraceae bacterium]
MKKRNLIIASVIVAVFVLVLALSVAACSPRQSVTDETVATLGTEPAETAVLETEPTETELHETEPIIEATEMPETEPQETEPQPTAAPAAVSTGSYSNPTPNVSNTPADTEPPATQPVVTTPPAEPAPTETAATEPAAPQPPATEPAPTVCQHDWQTVYHEEVSHKEYYCACPCGAKFSSNEAWSAHSQSYSAEEAILYHGGYASGSEWVVDTPAYSTWICSKCGAVSDTQP